MSMTSVDSDHPDADLGRFSIYTRDLIERSRAIQTSITSSEQAKGRLKPLHFRMEEIQASLKHIPRREQNADAQALSARRTAELNIIAPECQKILEAIAKHEVTLNEMLALQAKGEKQLIRSAGAVIRNYQRDIPTELEIGANLSFRLRVLADCARAPRIKAHTGHEYGRSPVVRVEAEPRFVALMHPAFEAHLQQENYSSRMQRFLDLIEPRHIKATGLPPQEDQAAKQQRVKQEAETIQARRRRITDRIDASINAIENAYDKIKFVRDAYDEERDFHHLTFERDISDDDVGEDAAEPGCSEFDSKYRYHMETAWERLRGAEAEHREAVNEAVVAKVQHSRENLLGVTDHEDDGFTQSLGSAYIKAAVVRFAGARFRINRWLDGAHGRAFRQASIPSDVADIPTGSDIRCGVSTKGRLIQFDNDLMA